MNGLDLALGAGGAALLAAGGALLAHARAALLRRGLCALLALSAALAVAAGLSGLLGAPHAATLPLGLPWLPMHVRLDALSGFFLLVIGLALLAVALYSVGYLRGLRAGLGPLAFFLALFVLGMQGVVLADDAYTFMLFWELMSVASYFLVVHEHEDEGNRRAGYLYLLLAHIGGLLILGAFAVLYAAGGSFEFAAMREASLSPLQASAAFLLAAFGFGMKAGVVPLHVWLPEAHPVAPSNASALMSGVMIKVAVFGFLRLVWDLVGLGDSAWWWGALLLAAGSASAVGGILLALQQHDLKRLLAYSSVENIGIVAIGLGLGMIFAHQGEWLLAALGLTAALYHVLNHALFKGLLFMGAGAVLHAMHEREMERMGGLIRRMPQTAALVLIGCLSISALPPLNGFVSEWLTFQTALMAPQLAGAVLPALVPFSAAMLALAGALAAACFVKVFGVVFLGVARSPAAEQAHEVDRWMLLGMALPALLCILLGLAPTLVIPLLDAVPQALLQAGIGESVARSGWLWLTPVSGERASYAAPAVLLGLLAVGALCYLLIARRGPAARRGAPWSCGHPQLSARMQYTAASYAQPLRRIFAPFYRPQEKVLLSHHGHRFLVKRARYAVHVVDLAWNALYLPIGRMVQRLARYAEWMHRRSIHAYLAYTFVTILVLLGWLV